MIILLLEKVKIGAAQGGGRLCCFKDVAIIKRDVSLLWKDCKLLLIRDLHRLVVLLCDRLQRIEPKESAWSPRADQIAKLQIQVEELHKRLAEKESML